MNMAIKSSKVIKTAEADQSVAGQKLNRKRKNENMEQKPSLKKVKLLEKQENELRKPEIQKNVNRGKNTKKAFGKSKLPYTKGNSKQKSKSFKSSPEKAKLYHMKKKKNSKQESKSFVKSSPEKAKLHHMKKKENSKQESKAIAKSSPEKAKLCQMKKKERKALRQKMKKNFDLSKQLKLLWEELRRDDIKEERKLQVLGEVSTLIKGHAQQLIFAHDTVRVIECLVALGTEAQKTVLFEELKELIVPMAKSRYAKFFVIKLLRYGTPEQKGYVMKAFHGKVIHLLRHMQAAIVVETAFNECANASQRAQLVQEFYGPHFMYFKDANLHNLAQLLDAKPDQKKSIIEHMKNSLEKVLEKGAHKYSIIHFVLREFMTNADPASRTDVIEFLQKVTAEILHTKDGSRVVMSCIWHGSAKVRKVIIKSFKGHVSKISQEEFGHMALLAIFDCVDDTKLVEKYIISEIIKDGKAIFLNQYGRKVVAYLVNPRDPLYFHPDVISILKQGDTSVTSKKNAELRKSELRNISSPLLLKTLLDHMQDLLLDNACCLLVATLLKHSLGDHTEVFQSLARLASQPYFPPEESSMHFIECNSSSLLLKKLIAADKGKKEYKNDSFSEVLIKEIPHGNFQSWIQCNRGAFLLVNLLETEIPAVVKRVTEEMKNLTKTLSCKAYTGAKILLKMLIKGE